MSTRLVLALTPVGEDALEQALFAPTAPFLICASVAEADELEPTAQRDHATAVLVSPELPGLTAGHCARLRARGLRLVGVALDHAGRDQLNRLGTETILDPDATTDTLAQALTHPREPAAPPPAKPNLGNAIANSNDAADPGRRGNVIAILGGKGAPGASECAASLATLAGHHWSTVLVELDALGGGLDLRLAADPHQGSLVAAARAAADQDTVAELLERWLVRRPGWPPVLLGPPDLTTISELAQPGVITRILASLARCFALVVCDTGWLLADTGQLTAPALVHRETIVAADAVLLMIGGRDDQLRSGLSQLDLVLDQLEIPAERLRITATGLGGPGTSPRPLITRTLDRELAQRGLALDATLPWDGRALRRATRSGLPLAQTSRRADSYRQALQRLLDELFLPATPTPRKRKLRLAIPTTPTERMHEPEEVALPWRS